MKEKIYIIDNLYDNPYEYHRGLKENKSMITEETIGKISQVLGHPIQVIQSENNQIISGVTAHLNCDWIALIYLSLPFDAFDKFGVKFYSHLETGLETFPTEKDIIKFKIDDKKLLEIFHSNTKLWKQYANVPAKYNRMVLFKGNLWHSYNEGDININNFILEQKLIIQDVR
jgi:hypothetical protein